MTEGNYGWAIYGHIRVGAQLKLRGSSHKIFKVAKEQQHELILATKCYGSDSALINPSFLEILSINVTILQHKKFVVF